MKRVFSLAGGLCAVVFILLGGGAAYAQTNAEINAGIQFNFSIPGARSLAMGGAFIGLADDATAAFANPAGLTILSKPEISFEYRGFDYTHRFTDGGRSFGMPSGDSIDTVDGLVSGESSTEVDSLSMFSFVYPKKNWAIAVYRHELANFEAAFSTQGAFFDAQDPERAAMFLPPDFEFTFRFFPIIADMSLEIINNGLSAGFKLNKKFSLGLGVSYYEFDMDSRTSRFSIRGRFNDPPDFSPSNELNFQELKGDDEDTTFIVGFLWNISEKWSLGGVYRQGPSFIFNTSDVAGVAATNPGEVFAEQEADFNVPDVYGLGIAFSPTDAITLSFDYVGVEYSALTDNVVNIFINPEDESPDADQNRAAARRISTDDVEEFHLGFEYVFFKLKNPIAIRFGGWIDPDHKASFEGQPNEFVEERNAFTLFQPGDDEIHYSVGLGIVFKDKLQLDAAADFSDLIDTVSLSGVFRF